MWDSISRFQQIYAESQNINFECPSITFFIFIQQERWKRKLRILDVFRPRLIRSEYLKEVEARGNKFSLNEPT